MAMISKFSAFIIILGCFAFALFVLLHHSAIRLEGESVISGYGKDRHLSKSSIYQQQLDKQANEIQSLIATTQKLLVDIKASNISLSQELLSDINNILAADRRGKEDLHSQYNACRHEAETCDAKFTQLSNRCNAANPNPNPNSKLNSPNPPTLILPNQQQHVPLLPPSRHESATTVSDTNPTSQISPRGEGEAPTDKWLVIGIPTVGRKNNQEYLLDALGTLDHQLPSDPTDPLYHKVLVHIVNLQKNTDQQHEHTVFLKAKAKYQGNNYFMFSELSQEEILSDPKGSGFNANNDRGNANKPGYLVRRQTRNIYTVMMRNLNRAKYYLFLEDDMQFCKSGLLAIQYLLAKAERYHPNWLAIRASYGMNGIFMHSKDLQVFGDYLLKHQMRRPPDHLVVEWFAGETKESKAYRGDRANIGFRYNLFNHIGAVSTLRSQKQTSFPMCYDALGVPVVFEVEAFSAKECPHDDVWPCRGVKLQENQNLKWK